MTDYRDLPEVGGGAFEWVKYTVTYSQIAAAATTTTVDIADIAPGTVVKAAVIKSTEAFTGGSLSAYNIGVTVQTFPVLINPENFLPPPSGVLFETGEYSPFNLVPFQASRALRILATSTGDNLDAATQGSVDVWVLVSTLP